MNNKQLNSTFNTQAYESREHAEGFYTPMNKPNATLENIQDVLECFNFVAECINNTDNDCCPDCGAPVDVYDKQHGCSNCGYGCSKPVNNAWKADADSFINYSELLFK